MGSQSTASSCESSDGTIISSCADPTPCMDVVQKGQWDPMARHGERNVSVLTHPCTEINVYLDSCLNILPNPCKSLVTACRSFFLAWSAHIVYFCLVGNFKL